MRVSAILKGRLDKQGRQTIQIRINDGKKRTFHPLKIKVKPSQFKDGKIISHPQAVIFNQAIKREIQNKEATGGVKVIDPDFFDYARKCIKYWRENKLKKESTLWKYETDLNKIAEYRSSFKLSEMNNHFFSGFISHCYKEGNVENTIWTNFSKIHAILQRAVKEQILIRNPVNDYPDRPKYRDPKRDFLTPEQIESVEKFALHGATPEQRFSTIWFLIGCYTGMRFGDMKTFNKKDIVGARLIKENQKTGETISLPVRGKIKELFELIDYKPCKITNEAYNRMLKVIAKTCDIHINLTAHTSRHSAAMLLANSGASIEETAAILGHTTTKHTKIYYKISNKRIDSAIDRIINPKHTGKKL